MINKIYIDLDGVLADFDGWMASIPDLTDANLWQYMAANEPHAYAKLKPMEDAFVLMEYLQGLDISLSILTAIPRRSSIPDAEQDKKDWVKRYLGDIEFHIGPFARDKQRFSGPGKILIDDKESNIQQWESKGGKGFLYRNFLQFQEEMEQYLRG